MFFYKGSIMFVQRIEKKTKNKKYVSHLVIENFREKDKVKHKVISNISKLPPHIIQAITDMLKGGRQLYDIGKFKQAQSIGAIKVVCQIAHRLGITTALGTSQQAALALFQIAGRIICHESRNYLANEWAKNQAVQEVFKLDNFNEDSLYANLKWLCKNQDKIESKLFKIHLKEQSIKEVYLYDVTSSYLEGEKNELADFGYNRDKKKGKKQIVIGLLTDKDGYPVSVEVFKGNTSDLSTVSKQLKKLRDNFGVERVIFVGDKGMVKSAQIEEIQSDEFKWNYLTSITKEQIKTLIKEKTIQLSMFDDDLVEVFDNDVRYILRRNPIRALEIGSNRQSKIEKVKRFALEQDTYLKEHPKAHADVALRKVNEIITKFKLQSILKGIFYEGQVRVETDIKKIDEASELDGCYALKTDVEPAVLSKELAHERYKDLSEVEFAFRTMKTTLEEVRPIYVRKKETTRGHVFVVMLAYMIIKYISDELKELNYTRKFIIESLDKIQLLKYEINGKEIAVIPSELLMHQQLIVDKLNIRL
jgi:transposase